MFRELYGRALRILCIVTACGVFNGCAAAEGSDIRRPQPSRSTDVADEYVVLLHGMVRTRRSMAALEAYFSDRGYRVLNLDYPSRRYAIPELAKIVRSEVAAKTGNAGKIHFVTHSLGGTILRYLQQQDPFPNLGRVVMLSPPNRGSEVVDVLGKLWLFKVINGPAGTQLGTDGNGIPTQLGTVDFELGVITGDRSINWINSLMIPGRDDGKVSVESAKVEGMADFLVVHVTHPFIMKDKRVMSQCLRFLENGTFDKSLGSDSAQREGLPEASVSVAEGS